MHEVIAAPLASYTFGSRFSWTGPLASLRASLRRWRRRAGFAAIASAVADLNPFLFQIESDH